MATYTKTNSTHQTLGASTVDTVNLSGSGTRLVVVNRGGTSEISFTYSLGGTASTPTAGGDDTVTLPATVGSYTVALGGEPSAGNVLQVKLISAGTPTYSVLVA